LPSSAVRIPIMLPTKSGAKPSWSHAMRARAPAGKKSSSSSSSSSRHAQGQSGTVPRLKA
jgi:hypothetical protein